MSVGVFDVLPEVAVVDDVVPPDVDEADVVGVVVVFVVPSAP